MDTPTHVFPIRIYYEDTDHSGAVYHGNYLKFMERGRTEMLRGLGLELDVLQRDYGVTFAVAEANIRFTKPARFNDNLAVESHIQQVQGARMHILQRVRREAELLAEANIHLACLGRHGGPVRIPAMILDKLRGSDRKGANHEQ
ncbi:MAG: tol-pal system-associated acyl-CoA thioesterase [Mariprofundaceae bacterium]